MGSHKIQNSHKKVTFLQILIPLSAFGAGVLITWVGMKYFAPPINLATESSVRLNGKYKLVSPLLICGTSEDKQFSQYTTLQSKLTNIINSQIQAGNATNVSVYFRDFKGKWVGINDDVSYEPASLLKVPIMIAYYKEAESDPSILSKKLNYSGTENANSVETFTSSTDLKPGTYTVNELLRAMIVGSDNNAAELLYDNMDKTWLSEVYSDLGLSLTPGASPTIADITAKQYSYFFRILYNATYLTPEYSEDALELLTGADFPQGLESTAPSGTLVANKFGERTVYTTTGTVVERQLHDCGIIYASSKPYLLCIMTRGKDFGALTTIIDTIGKTTYQEVQKNSK